jgi:hypothetical protein
MGDFVQLVKLCEHHAKQGFGRVELGQPEEEAPSCRLQGRARVLQVTAAAQEGKLYISYIHGVWLMRYWNCNAPFFIL